MKLPKGLGSQFGGSGMMQQMQQAMARAQTLEQELALEELSIDKGPVKAIFNGTGELKKISIDKSLLDPEELDVLEDLIVSVVRDGFTQATDLRNRKVQEIMPNIPNIPGF